MSTQTIQRAKIGHESCGRSSMIDLHAALVAHQEATEFPLTIFAPGVCDTCGEVRSGIDFLVADQEELFRAIAWERKCAAEDEARQRNTGLVSGFMKRLGVKTLEGLTPAHISQMTQDELDALIGTCQEVQDALARA